MEGYWMDAIKLNEKQTRILEKYMGLSEEGKRLIEYILKIGMSGIFSQEEFADLLLLLDKKL